MVCLGGNKEGFTFRQPGADHHARWMSKGVYYLKMFLLSHHFQLSEEEQEQITKIVTFVLIIYLKSWFEAPLASSAARTDLEFQLKIIKYRLLEPKAAFTTLQSIRRHHWYVTGQMVPLALVDKKLGKGSLRGKNVDQVWTMSVRGLAPPPLFSRVMDTVKHFFLNWLFWSYNVYI